VTRSTSPRSKLPSPDSDWTEIVHQLKPKTAQIVVNIGKERLVFIERKKFDLSLDGKD
jgi:hypothetical protein